MTFMNNLKISSGMVKNLAKSDEKPKNETTADIHGRMESIDQSLRSVDNRLRAVEKRLSGKATNVMENIENKDLPVEFEILQDSHEALRRSFDEIRNDSLVKDMGIRLNNLQAELAKLKLAEEGKVREQIALMQEKVIEVEKKLNFIDNLTNETHSSLIKKMEAQLLQEEYRISRLENVNKITIGKIKVPMEFSGLVASFVLLGTGYLIYTDHWSVIRSSYYPITIGLLFGTVVIAKFVMTNRE